MDCLFCKIIHKEIKSYILYEDDIVIVFLDAYPNSDGHTLIVPKKHYENLIDIDIETLNQINLIAKKIYQLLKDKLTIDGLTLNQNNEYGQDIKHYHLHLVPRYISDGYRHITNVNKFSDIEDIYNKIKN